MYILRTLCMTILPRLLVSSKIMEIHAVGLFAAAHSTPREERYDSQHRSNVCL
jgi:hypothetical protein